MSAHVAEALRLLEERETARKEKLEWARRTYVESVTSLDPPTGGPAALVEAIDELELGLAEFKFDAGIAQGVRELEVQLADDEDNVSRLEADIAKANEELAGLPRGDRRAGPIEAARSCAEDAKQTCQLHASILESSMKACAERSPRLFRGDFRKLAAEVRARRAAATAKAHEDLVQAGSEPEPASGADSEIAAAVPGIPD